MYSCAVGLCEVSRDFVPNQRVFGDPFADGWVGDAKSHSDGVLVDAIVEQVDCCFTDAYAVSNVAIFDAHMLPIVEMWLI